jgi:hypothetical protein
MGEAVGDAREHQGHEDHLQQVGAVFIDHGRESIRAEG